MVVVEMLQRRHQEEPPFKRHCASVFTSGVF